MLSCEGARAGRAKRPCRKRKRSKWRREMMLRNAWKASLGSYRRTNKSLRRKRGRENRSNLLIVSNQSESLGVFGIVGLQNDGICFYCAKGYKYYCENRFKDEVCASCDGKVDCNSCTYWSPVRWLLLWFSTGQDCYLCPRVLHVEKTDWKKLFTEYFYWAKFISIMFLYQLPLLRNKWVHGLQLDTAVFITLESEN